MGNEEESRMSEIIEDVRIMMRDIESKNLLEDGVQFSDDSLYVYIKQAIRDINRTPPTTSYDIETISDLLLVSQGTIIFALRSEGLLQMRNQLSYNDGGVSIDPNNKTGMYQSWAQNLYQEYERDKKEFKRTVLARRSGAGFIGISSQFSGDYFR